MASVHDVAAHILKSIGPVTAMKLQKLVYYCQAWSLVWDDAPLFPEKIQAWANGPVVYELYKNHRGQFEIQNWPWGDPGTLTESERGTVKAVLDFYGNKSGQWLSDLTHKELPWLEARADCPAGEPSAQEITPAAMVEYYGSL